MIKIPGRIQNSGGTLGITLTAMSLANLRHWLEYIRVILFVDEVWRDWKPEGRLFYAVDKRCRDTFRKQITITRVSLSLSLSFSAISRQGRDDETSDRKKKDSDTEWAKHLQTHASDPKKTAVEFASGGRVRSRSDRTRIEVEIESTRLSAVSRAFSISDAESACQRWASSTLIRRGSCEFRGFYERSC